MSPVMNCHRSTILGLRDQYQHQGNVNDRHRNGRPLTTAANQDHYIRVSNAGNRFLTAAETARQTLGTHNKPINEHTLRRRL